MSSSPNVVIIIGGGPVGLGAALELARFGVRSVVVEKHGGVATHPKARNFNTRTMDIARAWGPLVYGRLRGIDTPDGWKSPIRFLESATGREYGQIDTQGFVGPGPEISPAWPIMSSQDLLEQVMLDGARATGLVDLRFGVEATALLKGGGPGDDGVEIDTRETATGARERLAGRALVAADGASSFVRNALGVALEGDTGLSHLINCYFKADIERHIEARKGAILFISNPRVRGVLQPLDARGRWLCQIQVPLEDWTLDTFGPEKAKAWIREATGLRDLQPDILSLGLWKLNATVAERLVQGRIVLCGDAAHQFPPTGGLGVNTGLQGMHNVMWKLAYWMKGKADWSLVETYDAERRTVSRRIVDQSLENSINVGRIQAATVSGKDSGLNVDQVVAASRRYGNHLGVEFGAAYQSQAVVGDGTRPPAVDDAYSDYAPSAVPGCRAPHFWLGHPEERLSSLDLFGRAFTVLTADTSKAWTAAAAEASRTMGVPIDVYEFGQPGLADHGQLLRLYGVEGAGAVLVRPDGYVAWRSRSAADAHSLATVLASMLGIAPQVDPTPLQFDL
jgi:putative polyketide hydroxylase